MSVREQIESIDRRLGQRIADASRLNDNSFLDLVELQHKLKKIVEAESEKPTIAAFGELQKGKSGVVCHLLNSQKNPFRVKDEKGNMVSFWEEISPIGIGKELTGVLTRFTSFQQNDSSLCYMLEHPIMLKLFNVADMAAVLTQAYYSGLYDSKYYADDEIKAVTDHIFEKYSNMPQFSQDILVEADIIGVKDYLYKYVPGRFQTIYFEKLALVIRHVPQSEWSSVLKYLWHENPVFTELFQRLVDAMQRMGFARLVYADFDVVLHLGDLRNTILSKECLNGLTDSSWSATANIYVQKDGKLETVNDIKKCELSAICAEVVFKTEPEYLGEEISYFFDSNHCDQPGNMPFQTRMKLPDKVKRDFLVNTDLLDFPGILNCLSVKEDDLGNNDDSRISRSNDLVVRVVLRSKIVYLFNSYNESRILNILLFCHDNEHLYVNEMYRMINDWVEKYVGSNARARQQTITRCGGISPLFVIGTKFNIDMIEKPNEDGNSDAALNWRWSGRFKRVLYTESFMANMVYWFNNWDAEGSTFKNTYLLRDYKYSGCDGKGNNLYEGYDESAPNPTETKLRLSPGFYNRLRETFIANPDVRMFFDDPAKVWDVTATMNNDGSVYLAEKLSFVAKNIGEAKEKRLGEELLHIQQRLAAVMENFF